MIAAVDDDLGWSPQRCAPAIVAGGAGNCDARTRGANPRGNRGPAQSYFPGTHVHFRLTATMTQRLALVSLVVRDYDEAIAYFTRVLGFELREDTPLEGGKRWVRVGPAAGGAELLLARARTPEQRDRIGDQHGGRVGFFLHTDDFARDFTRMRDAGVQFAEAPREEPYGTVVVFTDCCGNRWDLVELRAGAT